MTASFSLVNSSRLMQQLVESHPNIEIWPDAEFHEGGFDYFWICSNVAGTVRNLAYVRAKEKRLESREYDQNGDDLWVAVE